jgi:hypothetical protein
VNGRTYQSNEICVDEELSTLVRWNVGDDSIEDTDYSQFEGVWWPAHIRHYINGRLRMEIDQTFSVIDGPIDWAALTPPNPATLDTCHQYRRPIIQSSAGAGPWYDVKVHGVIGGDGRVHEAAVLPKGRADLEKQALQIVSTWVFSPACATENRSPSMPTLSFTFRPSRDDPPAPDFPVATEFRRVTGHVKVLNLHSMTSPPPNPVPSAKTRATASAFTCHSERSGRRFFFRSGFFGPVGLAERNLQFSLSFTDCTVTTKPGLQPLRDTSRVSSNAAR